MSGNGGFLANISSLFGVKKGEAPSPAPSPTPAEENPSNSPRQPIEQSSESLKKEESRGVPTSPRNGRLIQVSRSHTAPPKNSRRHSTTPSLGRGRMSFEPSRSSGKRRASDVADLTLLSSRKYRRILNSRPGVLGSANDVPGRVGGETPRWLQHGAADRDVRSSLNSKAEAVMARDRGSLNANSHRLANKQPPPTQLPEQRVRYVSSKVVTFDADAGREDTNSPIRNNIDLASGTINAPQKLPSPVAEQKIFQPSENAPARTDTVTNAVRSSRPASMPIFVMQNNIAAEDAGAPPADVLVLGEPLPPRHCGDDDADYEAQTEEEASPDWKCPKCGAMNNNEESFCTSKQCEGKNHGRGETATSSWGTTFASLSSKWSCQVCLTLNESNVAMCMSCETPRGEKELAGGGSGQVSSPEKGIAAPAKGSIEPVSFSFGGSASTIGGKAAADAGGFRFGGAAPAAKFSPAPSSGFSFGSTNAATTDSAKSSSGIGLNLKPADTSAPAPSSADGFKFRGFAATGAVAVDSKAGPNDNGDPNKSTGFSFGSSAPKDSGAPALAGFSFGSSATTNSTPSAPAPSGFSFGTTPASTLEAESKEDKMVESNAPASGFSFVAAPAASTSGGDSPQDKPSGKSFSFSQSHTIKLTKPDSETKRTDANALPSAPTASSQPAAPLFSFGGSKTTEDSVTATKPFSLKQEKPDETHEVSQLSFGQPANTADDDGDDGSSRRKRRNVDNDSGSKDHSTSGINNSERGPENSIPGTTPTFGGSATTAAMTASTSEMPSGAPAPFQFGIASSNEESKTSGQSSAPKFHFGASSGKGENPASLSEAPATTGFGFEGAQATSSPSFGQSSKDSSAPAAAFKFGASQGANASNPSKPPACVQSSESNGKEATSAPTLFKFGASDETVPASKHPSEFGATPAPSFGSTAAAPSSSSGFGFGQQSSSSDTGSALVFGSAPASRHGAGFGSTFGSSSNGSGFASTPVTGFGSTQSVSNPASAPLGSTNSGFGSASAPPPSFGGTAGGFELAPAPPPSAFGSSNSFGPAPSSGFPASAPSNFGQPGFGSSGGFGAPAAAASGGFGAPAAGFGALAPAPAGFGASAFGGASAPAAGGFSMGTSKPATRGRRILRAKRPK